MSEQRAPARVRSDVRTPLPPLPLLAELQGHWDRLAGTWLNRPPSAAL